MSTKPFDASAFKDGQRAQWDNAAPGWKKWWPTIEANFRTVSDRLVEMASMEAGGRVLDVATGIGEPALTAARKVGPTGSVVATDLAPQMLSIARERAREAGLENVDFVEVDAEALDFTVGSFDAAVCRWGLMFMPDAPGVALRIHGFLRPGGRFAASVWGPPPEVPFLSMPMGVLSGMFDLPTPPPGTPGVFSLAPADALSGVLESAGFSNVSSEDLTPTSESSVADYMHMMKEVSAQITSLLADKPPDVQEEAWQAIERAASDYVGSDGVLRMENRAICASGEA